MIAVAFAGFETLGQDAGILGAAFIQTAQALAHERGQALDPAHLAAEAERFEGAHGRDVHDLAFASAVAPLLGAQAPDPSWDGRFRVAALDLVASHFIAFPAAAYVLGELRSMGIPQAILTFGYASVEHRKAAQLDFSGQILVGEDLGIACGTPAAFAALARALSLPADRIWFVGGAGGLDLASARAAGCRTVLVDANATISQAATRVAEFTIDSLADLLPLLGEPYTRSLLAMRYMLRTVMTWRPGHFVAAPVDPSKS